MDDVHREYTTGVMLFAAFVPEAIGDLSRGDMASAIFASMLTLIITHGVLVTKGVRALGVGGRHGQAIALTAVSQTASRIRILHLRLLAMHFTAALTTIAGLAKYALPVTDTGCRGSHRAMIASILLYDASLVLFLLAKTIVTNGARALARWETAITWWSRLYAWVYLPTTAAFLATKIPAVANNERTRCLVGAQDKDESKQGTATLGYATNNAMLIIQFALLLAMFVKPLMVSLQDSTASGRAVYRQVVIRNMVCTVGVAATYAITTAVVVVGVVLADASSAEGSKAADQLVDIAPSINIVATLCLTEIALPLGFSSSWPRCANVCNYWTAVRQEEEDQHSKAEAAMMVMQRPVHHGATSGGNTHHHHQEIARSSVVAIG